MADVDQQTIDERKKMRAAFELVFKTIGMGKVVLSEILDILHFYGPCLDEKDMALQNAAKAILHHLGAWGDSDEDRMAIVERLVR